MSHNGTCTTSPPSYISRGSQFLDLPDTFPTSNRPNGELSTREIFSEQSIGDRDGGGILEVTDHPSRGLFNGQPPVDTEDENLLSPGAISYIGARSSRHRPEDTYAYRLSTSDMSLLTFKLSSSPVRDDQLQDSAMHRDTATTHTQLSAGRLSSSDHTASGSSPEHDIRRMASRQSWMSGTDDGTTFFTAHGSLSEEVLNELRDSGFEIENAKLRKSRDGFGGVGQCGDEPECSSGPHRRGQGIQFTRSPGLAMLFNSQNVSPNDNHDSEIAPAIPEQNSSLSPEDEPESSSHLGLGVRDRIQTAPDNLERDGMRGGAARMEGYSSLIVWDGIVANGEKAFWDFIMPSMSTVTTFAENLSSVIASLSGASSYLVPTSNTGSTTDRFTRALYSDETIYTVRFPSEQPTQAGELGSTIRPVFVRRRAALPEYTLVSDVTTRGVDGSEYHDG